MARFKLYDYRQRKMVAVDFESQILPGTFEYTLSYLIDHKFDLSGLEARYENDETGAPAYDPSILLKIILYAYSRGIASSRGIARACEENVVFMALSADTQPHFTTIAAFISSLGDEAKRIFRDVLLVCDEEGLIGREMFALDGVKLPSNASKEWSGTRADFERKARKMEQAVEVLVTKHRREDKGKAKGKGGGDGDGGLRRREEQTKQALGRRLEKIQGWLETHEDKVGRSGKPVKSNLTDGDSAKMASSHGVIQGYDALAVVDSKHQVVVNAEVFGEAQEQALLRPMLEGAREQFAAIGRRKDVLREVIVAADSGFHSKANVAWLYESGIDAYLADNLMRKRDPRYTQAGRHDPGRPVWGNYSRKAPERRYEPSDFHYDAEQQRCICPMGKRMYLGFRGEQSGRQVVRFKGTKGACLPCPQRARCLRYPERSEIRQVAFFGEKVKRKTLSYVDQMKAKVDSELGRLKYAMRLAVAEPPFANIRSTLRLDRFTLRGKPKVNAQWLMYCMVHNIGKIHRYAYVEG